MYNQSINTSPCTLSLPCLIATYYTILALLYHVLHPDDTLYLDHGIDRDNDRLPLVYSEHGEYMCLASMKLPYLILLEAIESEDLIAICEA